MGRPLVLHRSERGSPAWWDRWSPRFGGRRSHRHTTRRPGEWKTPRRPPWRPIFVCTLTWLKPSCRA